MKKKQLDENKQTKNYEYFFVSAFSQYFKCTEMLRFTKYLQYTKKFGAGALAHANDATPLKATPLGLVGLGRGVFHAIWDEESTSCDKNFPFGACLKRSIHIAQ